MKLKVIDPTHPLPPMQMGVSMTKMDDIFTVLDPMLRSHLDEKIPRSITLQKIADLCDNIEEFASVLDIYYSWLHEQDAIYP